MNEQRVKIGYMCNFLMRSISWPRKISPMSTKTGTIYIAGNINLSRCFKIMVRNNSDLGIRINLECLTDAGSIPDCHILFIGKAAAGRLSHILEQTRNRPILTISDVKEFADKGGMIELVKVRQKGKTTIKTRVNAVAAEAGGLF